MGKNIRILLVDDHETTRMGLATILSRRLNLDVVGEASDGEMALDLARELNPDVVVMDVFLPNLNGIDATRLIVEEHPETKVIGFSMHPKSSIVNAMREAGAVTCISKSESAEVLIAAIQSCMSDSARPAGTPDDSPGDGHASPS
jgi:DNA-binding NarL/FixJ family response regulator